jgi:CRISPR-associated exonuclease Cas4
MMSSYHDEDFLMLSGIQHMAFCERQWALIHIEQAWAENILTVEGKHLHERTDDPFEDETRKDIRVVRAMPIVSRKLGLRGVADVVEFHRVQDELKEISVKLKNRKGWWRPFPVEYKRGRAKPDDRDIVQLCAQAIALEEMLNVFIDTGYLFYGQTRHRETIVFDQSLRLRVEGLSHKMHKMMLEGLTPEAQKGKHCSMCSLIELCQPNLKSRKHSIRKYLEKMTDLEVKDL